MKQKPSVCVIDEDPFVKEGWLRSLKSDAELHYFSDHLGVFKKAATDRKLISSFSCIVMGRHFNHLDLDIVGSAVPETLKSSGGGPIFLNWQGYISKEDLGRKFDGKLFHRYGVRWQTLRLRIQKFEKRRRQRSQPIGEWFSAGESIRLNGDTLESRPERCSALLRSMARNASGLHKEKIAFYADHDTGSGVRLLEAIYNKLVTDKNRPDSCPSRYINSSPVIAKRILREALFS